jgi:hypothetical protein
LTNDRYSKTIEEARSGLTDAVGLVPYTDKWLLYWDRQYALYLAGQDENAIRRSGVAEYRAVMQYTSENPASLARMALGQDAFL